MLNSLHISNYALIDVMDIEFHDGFNVITGETGAGKSILLSALALLLGGRADMRVVTNPEQRSVIEAVFSIGHDSPARQLCLDNDIDWDPAGTLILRREISAGTSSRSRAFVNDSPVNVNILSQLGIHLIDIHSQHQNQLLSKPAFQLDVLDTFANTHDLKAEYAARYKELRQAVKALKTTKARIEEAQRNADLLRYRYDKLAELDLKDNELSELESEQAILSNLTEIKASLTASLGFLGGTAADSDTPNALERLQQALRNISGAKPAIPEEDKIPERLESAYIELSDIFDSLSKIDQALYADPNRLTFIDNRIHDIHDAMHANDVATYDELIAAKNLIQKQLADLDDSSEVLNNVRNAARRAKQAAEEVAQRLSSARKKGAKELEKALRDKAAPLGMHNIVADIALTPCDLCPTGADAIDFRFAFNKNQTPMSIGNTASGGEISRLMLATKTLLAETIALPTIIFDEIDTGVSGDIAGRVGQLMRDIARATQVIAITHLPQVAALADTHFSVYKCDDDHATHSRIECLDSDARVEAIASMLSGDRVTDAARINAQTLLKQQ